MSYEVKQGDIFGRIGTGFGQGLAEQVPKEIERNRLASGLQQFEKESANLTPIQQLARLSAIPGITPQMIQSFGELGRQQAKANAISNLQSQTVPSPFPNSTPTPPGAEEKKAPSLTEEETLAKAQQGYIPPTQEQLYNEAGKAFNENPALFENNPAKAIQWAEDKALREEAIAQAHQKRHEDLTRIQDNVVKRLKDHSGRLGVEIPANVYSKIEDEAIQATKPKNKGGNGLTEQQAMKKYGEELDRISRDYQGIKSIGNWSVTGRKPDETIRNIKSLQKKFKERDDTENFGDKLISETKLSPIMAYSFAEPVYQIPKVKNELSNLPPINKTRSEDPIYETLLIAPKLAETMGQEASPLAIAFELKKKGYDPQTWLSYVTDNQKNLKLLGSQIRQLDKPNSLLGTFNDWWLSSWTGLEEIQ